MASDIKQRLVFRNGRSVAVTDSETPSPCSPEPSSIRQARRTAKRLHIVEQELVRRIVEQYEIDDKMHKLLAELQICSSRMREQINDCASGCHRENVESQVSIVSDRRSRR